MKRNVDLTHEILSHVEEADPFVREPESINFGNLEGHWDVKEISYHLVLLLEEGFLARDTLHKGNYSANLRKGDDEQEDAGLRLTWKGHDLLDELREKAPRY